MLKKTAAIVFIALSYAQTYGMEKQTTDGEQSNLLQLPEEIKQALLRSLIHTESQQAKSALELFKRIAGPLSLVNRSFTASLNSILAGSSNPRELCQRIVGYLPSFNPFYVPPTGNSVFEKEPELLLSKYMPPQLEQKEELRNSMDYRLNGIDPQLLVHQQIRDIKAKQQKFLLYALITIFSHHGSIKKAEKQLLKLLAQNKNLITPCNRGDFDCLFSDTLEETALFFASCANSTAERFTILALLRPASFPPHYQGEIWGRHLEHLLFDQELLQSKQQMLVNHMNAWADTSSGPGEGIPFHGAIEERLNHLKTYYQGPLAPLIEHFRLIASASAGIHRKFLMNVLSDNPENHQEIIPNLLALEDMHNPLIMKFSLLYIATLLEHEALIGQLLENFDLPFSMLRICLRAVIKYKLFRAFTVLTTHPTCKKHIRAETLADLLSPCCLHDSCDMAAAVCTLYESAGVLSKIDTELLLSCILVDKARVKEMLTERGKFSSEVALLLGCSCCIMKDRKDILELFFENNPPYSREFMHMLVRIARGLEDGSLVEYLQRYTPEVDPRAVAEWWGIEEQ